MAVPRIDKAQAQHYLSMELIAGVLFVTFNSLTKGEFPGGRAFFPLILAFFLLAVFSQIPGLGTAVAVIGLIFVITLALTPTAVKDKLLANLLFDSTSSAARKVAEEGVPGAKGYGE